jgi:hypothetical protein
MKEQAGYNTAGRATQVLGFSRVRNHVYCLSAIKYPLEVNRLVEQFAAGATVAPSTERNT